MADQIVLTPEEVAEKLKITKNTVYELIKRGDLIAYKVGNKVRVDESDLIAYIQSSKGVANKNTVSTQTNGVQNNTPMLSSVVSNTASLLSTSGQMPITTGDSETFAPLKGDFPIILCGQDPSLDILANMIQHHPEGTTILRSQVGSFSGLLGLYHNQCHMTASHLWDGDTGSYNLPYVRRLIPGISCVVLRIAKRTQGFYVAKGNPKKIKSWLDLTRTDITMVNREKGSGTRVLLDEQLRLLSIDTNKIKGYDHEETSHLSIASAISRGKADVGIGRQLTLGSGSSLDFIPLHVECYDLVIKKTNLNQPIFKLVYDLLNSNDFKEELLGLGGYDTSATGELIGET